VRFLEVVDVMVGQLLRRLWEAQQQQGEGPFLLAVTGDHSTPVVFGDHSHEPVPFAAAHVQDVVSGWAGRPGCCCQHGQVCMSLAGAGNMTPSVGIEPTTTKFLSRLAHRHGSILS
jgi:2,3-bisphosphoglycerate-independent phosphoglycerate mutase